MITTRKELAAKLEEMNKSEIVVKYGDYRNTHPLCATPLQKKLAELIGAKAVEARTYTTKNGAQKTSPVWLVALYRRMAAIVYVGTDINVRMMIAELSR